jgi:hypothetical protein
VHHAGPWIEMTQIQAELAQDRNAIDTRPGAQMLRALKPMLHDLSRNRFSRFELTHQKAIQVNEDFLGTDIVSASGATCLKKRLKPKGQRTAEKTGCLASSFFGPGHRHFSKSFQIRLGINESRVDGTMAKDVGDGLYGRVVGQRSNGPGMTKSS